MLTAAWAGTETQGPLVFTERLVELGYVRDGTVTPAGLKVRRQIEDATNQGVGPAFAVVDADALLEILLSLPPTERRQSLVDLTDGGHWVSTRGRRANRPGARGGPAQGRGLLFPT